MIYLRNEDKNSKRKRVVDYIINNEELDIIACILNDLMSDQEVEERFERYGLEECNDN